MNKFSIITPFYNNQNEIGNCISSILKQTYTEFELLLINDGSTDGSLKAISKFNDERIKLINLSKNQGQTNARNKGLDIMTGDFLVFVDADDTINENALETYNQIFSTHSDVDYIKLLVNQSPILNGKVYEINNSLPIKKDLVGFTWSNIWRIKDRTLRCPIKYKMTHTELGLSYRLLNTVEKVYFLRQDYYNYIEYKNSVSHRNYTQSQWETLISDYLLDIKNTSLKPFIRQMYGNNVKQYINSKIYNKNTFLKRLDNVLKQSPASTSISDVLQKCTGCFNCYNACPTKAIQMTEDPYGFKYPNINNSKCISCGKCRKVCPSINTEYYNKNPNLYGMTTTNNDILKSSSSGGIFTYLAMDIINKGGLVCGVEFNHNTFEAHHIIVDNINDLEKLRCSKYVQSNIGNVFNDIKSYLQQKKPVLFVGTPCQVSAISKYIQKDTEYLTTVDVLCHGVPSSKVLNRYVKEKFKDIDIKSLHFRLPDIQKTELFIKTPNGETIKDNGEFIKLFVGDYCLRESCYDCKFNKIPRQGDITIGDLWNAKKYQIPFKYNKISLVLTNTEKGQNAYDQILQNKEIQSVKLPIDSRINNNVSKSSASALSLEKRNTLLNNVFNRNMTFDNKFYYEYGIVPYSSNNYGSALTSIAIYKFLESNNKSVSFISDKGVIYDFGKQTIKTLKLNCIPYSQLKINTAIVPSDCSWAFNKSWYDSKLIPEFTLEFMADNIKRISIAASMGDNLNLMETSKRIRITNNLSKFDLVTVREQFGVDLCKKLYNVDAAHVLDPIFYLNQNTYDELIKMYSKIDIPQNYIFAYIMSPTTEKRDYLLKVSKDLGKELVIVLNKEYKHYNTNKSNMNLSQYVMNNDLSALDWLKYLKNADLIITDSFHGCAFSILYHKTFLGINNRGLPERMNNLRDDLQLNDNIISQLKGYNDLPKEINYETVQQKLDILITQSLDTIIPHL